MSSVKKLTTFSLVMMTVVSIDSMRNLPGSALLGTQLVTCYLVAGILFFIPAAMVSAHLSAMMPGDKGVYAWVSEAFGRKWGLVAVWLQWMSNVIWYPALLSFVSATMAYVVQPELAVNPTYLALSVAAIFALMTYVSCLGIQISAWFSTFTSLFGLVLPMLIIITLGCLWFYWGQPTHLTWQASSFSFSGNGWQHWFSLTAIVLSLCGIELTTVHAHDVKDPQKAFPKALFWSTVIILTTLILGSLTIAAIMPKEEISLVTGIMQMIERFLAVYHLKGLAVWLAALLVIGGAGSVLNWIIGPTRGLMYAFEPLSLPASLVKRNRHKAPVGLLMVQAVLVVLLSCLYFIFDEINQTYWVLTAAASQLYMLMYLLMFAACWKLRDQGHGLQDVFTIPGKRKGLFAICLTGFLGSFMALLIGFIPPDVMHFEHTHYFVIGMFLLLVILLIPAFGLSRQDKQKT